MQKSLSVQQLWGLYGAAGSLRPVQARRPGVFDCSIARWSAASAARLWPHRMVGQRRLSASGRPDCFPYLSINVLSSPGESVRQTGSYTLLLDDFLRCVNKFQLRCDLLHVLDKQLPTGTMLDLVVQTGNILPQ